MRRALARPRPDLLIALDGAVRTRELLEAAVSGHPERHA
jgi:hypothetical protein